MHSLNLLTFPLLDRIQRFFNGPHPHVEKHQVSFTLMNPVMSPKASPVVQRRTSSPLNPPKHIPNEIVLKILEAAYDPQDLESTHHVLMNSALVCRDWSILAQKLLFHHVTLRSQASLHSLSDALSPSTPRGRMLADAVIRFSVILDHNQPNGVPSLSFASLFGRCSRVQELDVSLFGRGAPGNDVVGSPTQARMQRNAPSFDDEVLSMLRAGPSITRLRFSNWTDNSSTLSQLLHLWPTLRSLEIRGTALPTIPPLASTPFPCALSELRLNCQRAPSFEFLKWLLLNSRGSLRRVYADRQSCSDVLARVVREHNDSVESISMPTCQTREAAFSLMQCQGLRHLHMEDARVTMVLCKTLPTSLQHVSLGLHRETEMKPLLHLISESAGLASITLHLWKGGESHGKLDAVHAACALRGVQLNIVNDIREFRASAY
ncbi:hypothetical protein EUX98_g3158 [Antrodiella citrinella]|uniref:F-box domain-containing protein n=1 Tax=Antrodiella citrinella TaxID=2447956 RepID=A0A4S4MX87_9APHY|nr:hypothetical protein EUX98_g3158 [Antrodiella citrinella]